MDPNPLYDDLITLAHELVDEPSVRELRHMKEPHLEDYASKCADLAGMILTLNEWLAYGGFLPDEWRQ